MMFVKVHVCFLLNFLKLSVVMVFTSQPEHSLRMLARKIMMADTGSITTNIRGTTIEF